MFITKKLDTTVDLINPSDIYSPDISSVIVYELEQRYVGKCYRSVFILGINKILRRGPIIIRKNELDGCAYVDVQFLADCFILVQGEVLHGCNIAEIYSNAIIATNKYANIKLKKNKKNPAVDILSVGDKIPIVVEKVRYIPCQNSVSVMGTPYLPRAEPTTFWRIARGMSNKEKNEIKTLLDTIEDEDKLHKDISKGKAYKFFSSLMYPYKVDQKTDKSKWVKSLKMKSVKLEDSLELSKAIVCYPDGKHKSDRVFYKTDDKFGDKLSNKLNDKLDYVVDVDAFPYVADMCNRYLLHMQALRGFVETYTDMKDINKLMTYWRVCKSAKQ